LTAYSMGLTHRFRLFDISGLTSFQSFDVEAT
jgi:hypothetical protein